ncbi:hypothetical protein TVAG_047980 [Trichomonas vaginalis G3]|uniref:Transmembrane protein n=1 Tax=Trichomonas vaginalis (strain ATCC PRA-98 / G3) TaxID=412133 RepID=A2EZH7_TRIV3|nr:hypothetical protein TVAGG3_0657530 [Trichomonas vaginalis G3]EAY01943.1 hypothetical protein TVAG_047980 [Trichomonas vaginalis G3]KAI5506271.1 hypothetical protein TVAGG3_0657530 [Trichomonas vaginalis G3]|eukprot:XP_001330458.1 hypothetical protein [Trichomonas vaginalis G3]
MSEFKWGPVIKASYVLVPCEVLAAACASAALLGVSLSKTFSIIFGILLIIFTIVFAFTAWKTADDKFMRICSAIAAVLMPIAAIGCFIVDKEFIKTSHPAAKSPLYMFIAAALLIDFTINIIQLINVCSFASIKDRLLSNNRQITALFVLNLVLGLALGLTFGLLDVEDEDTIGSRMAIVTGVFAAVGLLCGFGFAVFNERETQKLQKIGLDPLAPQGVVQHYDEM